MTPLLREMILRAIHLESQPRLDDFRQRLQGLILSEIANLERMPLYLPMPRDRRLQAICQALLKQPELGLTSMTGACGSAPARAPWRGCSPRNCR